MRRILLISRCPPYPLYLGDRLIIWHLMRELEARHYEIDLLAFSDRPEDAAEIDQYDGYFGEVRLFPLPVNRQATYIQRILLPSARFPRRAEQASSPAMWQAIQQQIANNSYDLVHVFGGVQVYEYFHALGNLPTLITPYESYSLYLRRVLENSSGNVNRMAQTLQLRLAQQFESWMFAPYQQVVVLSDQDRDALHELNPALKITVIPNGIDLYNFRLPKVRKRAKALLFVGNYDYAPNADAALLLAQEILPQVRQQEPDVKLWLVGNAPTAAMQALASDHIKVTGRVPDVRPYLARASAFVCPLRFGAGIKNKVLEALALSLPVVATPLSVDGIHVQHEESVLIADVDTFAAAVIRLLRDAPLQQMLSAQGRSLIEREYSWSQVAQHYIALYDDLV